MFTSQINLPINILLNNHKKKFKKAPKKGINSLPLVGCIYTYDT